jgi:CubicO group peptidase (beta-lactamase class C family)
MMRTPLTAGIPSLDPYPPESGTLWGFTVNLRLAVPGSASTDGFGHAGWAGTEMWIHPEHDVAWVLLTNVGGAGARGWDPTPLDNAIVARA